MGGAESAVSDTTTDIVLECAHFDPVSIRKTRTRLNLKTDASDRFEKGLDPNLVEKAMARALELLEHIAKPSTMEVVDAYAVPEIPKTIEVSLMQAQSLLGVAIDPGMVSDGLKRLGFGVTWHKSREAFEVEAPTFRVDVTTPEDVIEDIGKLVGYDAVAVQAPRLELSGVTLAPVFRLTNRMREYSADNGFSEVLNYAFYSERDAKACGLYEEGLALELENPMNPDQALMRTSLLPNLLKNVRENLKREKSVALFECGSVYFSSEYQPVHENTMFAQIMVASGNDDEAFFALKGISERMAVSLGFDISYDTAKEPGSFWHPTRTAEVFCGVGKSAVHIGRIGEIHPFAAEAFGIKRRVAYMEIDVATLLAQLGETKSFVAFRKYPEVLRDLSLSVPKAVRVKDISEHIMRYGGGLVLGAELFDRYEDASQGLKSLAFHIRFGADNRTLEGAEVDAALEKIVASLTKELKVERR